MSSSRICFLISILLASIFFLNRPVYCDDDDHTLLQGINAYRTSLNLTALTKNSNAACLADKIADQLKPQPCTNTTGSNTIPGTEPQFSDYPNLLTKCHLNVSNTRDGTILPACVPGLVPSIVLTNFTQSLYSGSLNDTQYMGAGIGSEGNWIVVVLTTSTPEGSFAPATATDPNSSTLLIKIDPIKHVLFLVMILILLL